MSKIVVVTTFPNAAWQSYAKTMVVSFCEFWPKDMDFFVSLDSDVLDLDKLPREEQQKLPVHQVIQELSSLPRQIHASPRYSPDLEKFLLRHQERLKAEQYQKDFRKCYIRFAHKVFAMNFVLDEAANFCPDAEYLVWLDADVMTKGPVSQADIESWLPGDKIASYLGRTGGWTSETGFIAFNLKEGGREFLRTWKSLYEQDKPLEWEDHTDAYAFDRVREEFNAANGKDVFRNLSEGIEGRDVFEKTQLGKLLEHFKGPRKKDMPRVADQAQPMNVMDVNAMPIITKNCVNHDVIKANVTRNLQVIQNWLQPCRPTDEEVVLCSAGPSLSVDEIRPFYDRGVKIVAVKHAMDTLISAGIIPWACILLDPRQHVANFVKYPHPDVHYFAASMVDPEVTSHLRKLGRSLWGYHAHVGAEETKIIPYGHHIINGGSATATRGITLLAELLGFRKMHLFAYDACYFKKPDLSELKESGKKKYEEMTLQTPTWGGKLAVRTFWTEGQFLAQVNEFRHLYMDDETLELHTYGDGAIPWMHKHQMKFKAWLKERSKRRDENTMNAPDINGLLANGISEFSHQARQRNQAENRQGVL